MSVADVLQEKTRIIRNILVEQKNRVLFAERAAYNNNILPESIYEEAFEVLSKYKAEAIQLGVIKICGIATDIFRKAENGHEFITRLSLELDLDIEIIDQNKEGELGFLSTAHVVSQYLPPIEEHNLVSWDSGNSSVQFTTLGSNQEFVVYKSPFGIVPIKRLLEKIRQSHFEDVSIAVNPISIEEMDCMLTYMKNSLPEIPTAIENAVRSGTVVRKFSSSWLVSLFQADEVRVVTKKEVQESLARFIGKSDDEIKLEVGNVLFDPELTVISLISLYGMMDKLAIPSIRFASVSGNTYGLLLDSTLWQKQSVE